MTALEDYVYVRFFNSLHISLLKSCVTDLTPLKSLKKFDHLTDLKLEI